MNMSIITSGHPRYQGGKMLKYLGGNFGCKDKKCLWHLNGCLKGSSIGATV